MNIVAIEEVTAEDEPPTELTQRRVMIKEAVDAAANGVIADIKNLRLQLDDLENLVIQSAARVSDNLFTHVGICEAAQIEVHRLSGVVAGMRDTQIDHANEHKGHSNGNGSSVL